MADASTPRSGGRFVSDHWDATEQVALAIRRYIEREDLAPGHRLGTEQQLAAEFGVSRPTLREALRLLASSHLVRSRQGPGGGIFVASTPKEGMGRNVSESVAAMLATESVSLPQLLEARRVIEIPLAGLAARNAGPETVAELREALEAAEGHVPGGEEFSSADARFHRALAAAAGNDLLVAFSHWMVDVLQPSIVDLLGAAVRAEDILDQHRAILRAISRHQPRAAERAMAAHIDHLQEAVERARSGAGEAA